MRKHSSNFVNVLKSPATIIVTIRKLSLGQGNVFYKRLSLCPGTVCIQGGLHLGCLHAGWGWTDIPPHPKRLLCDTVNERRYASYWNAFLLY